MRRHPAGAVPLWPGYHRSKPPVAAAAALQTLAAPCEASSGAAGTQDNTPGQQLGETNTLPALCFDVHVTFFTLHKNKSLLWQSANVLSKYEDDIENSARCFSFRGLLDPCKVTNVWTLDPRYPPRQPCRPSLWQRSECGQSVGQQ